jgi:hypothetical protein
MASKMCKWKYVNIVPQVSKRCLFKAVVTRGNHIALIYGHAFPTNGLKVWSTVNQTATQSCVCVCACVFTNKDILADLRRNGMCVSHKPSAVGSQGVHCPADDQCEWGSLQYPDRNSLCSTWQDTGGLVYQPESESKHHTLISELPELLPKTHVWSRLALPSCRAFPLIYCSVNTTVPRMKNPCEQVCFFGLQSVSS